MAYNTLTQSQQLTVVYQSRYLAAALHAYYLCSKSMWHLLSFQSTLVMGVSDVHVEYNGQSHNLPLVVVDGHSLPLFGRKWLRKIKLSWSPIFNIFQHFTNCEKAHA